MKKLISCQSKFYGLLASILLGSLLFISCGASDETEESDPVIPISQYKSLIPSITIKGASSKAKSATTVKEASMDDSHKEADKINQMANEDGTHNKMSENIHMFDDTFLSFKKLIDEISEDLDITGTSNGSKTISVDHGNITINYDVVIDQAGVSTMNLNWDNSKLMAMWEGEENNGKILLYVFDEVDFENTLFIGRLKAKVINNDLDMFFDILTGTDAFDGRLPGAFKIKFALDENQMAKMGVFKYDFTPNGFPNSRVVVAGELDISNDNYYFYNFNWAAPNNIGTDDFEYMFLGGNSYQSGNESRLTPGSLGNIFVNDTSNRFGFKSHIIADDTTDIDASNAFLSDPFMMLGGVVATDTGYMSQTNLLTTIPGSINTISDLSSDTSFGWSTF